MPVRENCQGRSGAIGAIKPVTEGRRPVVSLLTLSGLHTLVKPMKSLTKYRIANQVRFELKGIELERDLSDFKCHKKPKITREIKFHKFIVVSAMFSGHPTH